MVRFDDNSRKIMAYANQVANKFGSDSIEAVHVLLGLIKPVEGTLYYPLKQKGYPVDEFIGKVMQSLGEESTEWVFVANI